MAREEVQNLMDGYWAIKDEIVQMRRQADSALKELKDILSPVKVGDVVTVNGYSHKGKRMLVTRVWAELSSYRKEEIVIRVCGDVLKKDGMPGLNSAENYYSFNVDEVE